MLKSFFSQLSRSIHSALDDPDQSMEGVPFFKITLKSGKS